MVFCFQKRIDIGLTKRIDRLFGVSHQVKRFEIGLQKKSFKNFPLDWIGILKFIDDDGSILFSHPRNKERILQRIFHLLQNIIGRKDTKFFPFFSPLFYQLFSIEDRFKKSSHIASVFFQKRRKFFFFPSLVSKVQTQLLFFLFTAPLSKGQIYICLKRKRRDHLLAKAVDGKYLRLIKIDLWQVHPDPH